MAERKANRQKPTDRRPEKKVYTKPVLTEYGSVAKLTRTTISGAQGDGGVHPANRRI